MEGLKKHGWHVERGNRTGDWYLCPPGVMRGKGFKPRIDYFDSIPLVRQCLESDARYCNQAEIVDLVSEAKKLGKLLRRVKEQGEKIPNFTSERELRTFFKSLGTYTSC